MKAACITHYNQPWEIVERPIPQPKEGQVLIKIHACGLCGTDLHVHHGLMPVSLPCVPGHEPVGEIVEKGPGVTHLQTGDRVGVSWVQSGCGRCPMCQGANTKYCPSSQTWKDMGGGMAEYMVAWASGCTLLPNDLSYEDAAPLFCAGFTIASGFYNGRPRPGDTVAVVGIGGLGHLAIQYAKAKGHKVIAITSSSNKKELAMQLGADEVLIADGHLPYKISSRIDVLLHTGNATSLLPSLFPLMNPEGRIVIMGLSDSPIQAQPFDVVPKQLTIQGSVQNKRSELVDILTLASKKKIKPMIELYSLNELPSIVDKLQAGTVRFRAVVQF